MIFQKVLRRFLVLLHTVVRNLLSFMDAKNKAYYIWGEFSSSN